MNDAPLDDNAIVSALRREYDAADSYYLQLRGLQWAARDYYEGRPFGNEEDGQSQIVLPDVQESCDYMAASVLRTFVSSDYVVELEATDEEDEDIVADATAALNHNFMREQDGYRILLDVCTDGLIEKYGVFKSMMTTREEVTRHQVQLEGQKINCMRGLLVACGQHAESCREALCQRKITQLGRGHGPCVKG